MALDIYRSPFTLMSNMASQSSGFPLSMGSSPWAFPALLIKISICEKTSGKLSMAPKTAFLSLTSKLRVWMSTSLPSSFLSWSNLSCLLPQRIILNLCFAKSSAVAFPIPLVAPVINAVFLILCFLRNIMALARYQKGKPILKFQFHFCRLCRQLYSFLVRCSDDWVNIGRMLQYPSQEQLTFIRRIFFYHWFHGFSYPLGLFAFFPE